MSKNIIECGKGWAKIYNPIIKKILDFDSTKKNECEKIGILDYECLTVKTSD